MMWKTQPRSKSSNNIAYYREGSGASILFIHGVGLRLESWNAQLKYLKDHFDVIAIDLPGHGESDHQTSNNINIDYIKIYYLIDFLSRYITINLINDQYNYYVKI